MAYHYTHLSTKVVSQIYRFILKHILYASLVSPQKSVYPLQQKRVFLRFLLPRGLLLASLWHRSGVSLAIAS